MQWKTVAVFGVGLIGGSFALALRKAGFEGRILGVSSAQTLRSAIELGVVDQGASLEEAASQADLLYLAQPIRQIMEVLPQLNRWVQPEALITDAGSTKAAIVAEAARSVTRCEFVGGHPLAGKESRGVQAAEANLFEGRTYVLTPTDGRETEAGAEFGSWVRRIGSTPLILDPAEHDRVVAFTSHLPQLASTALASLLGAAGPKTGRIFGPALVDSTRLALSSYDVWTDIVSTNSAQIESALTAYIRALEQVRAELRSEQLRSSFERAAQFAAELRQR